jgi:hypothetical protein
MTGPWTFDEARDKTREAEAQQRAAEDFVKDAHRQYAHAEDAYRKALADKIVTLRADNWPATVCADLARGDKHVARLRRERDIAIGVKDAAGMAGWRRNANRRDVQRFVEWSMRRELAEVGVGA